MSEYKATDAPDNLTDWEACAWAAGAEYGAHVEREKWQMACSSGTTAERDRLRAVNKDLLKCCKELLAEYEGDFYGPCENLIKESRAAIAKAEKQE